MNILNRLTKKNLALNKKRTIVTIIGILLSTALIVCVSGMVTSFQKTLVNATIESDGNYHAFISDMNKKDLLALEENRTIKDFYLISDLGYAEFETQNPYKPYLFIRAFDEKALKNLGLDLLEGRLPQSDTEIVLSQHFLEDSNFDKKLGDTITLNIGKRFVKDETGEYELHQSNMYVIQDNQNSLEEKEYFVPEMEKSFTIVGIINRPTYTIENYEAPGYTCITYSDKIEAQASAAILYKNPRTYKENTKEIAGETYDYSYNNELLRWLGVSQSETMSALYVVAIIVIGIIIISSVFVIKNSFAISITEKYKMYGMLRSVGATSKQIKKNVLFEGFLLGLIAIPLGILLGIVAIVILVFLINFILADMLNDIKFVYSIPIYPIILSVLLSSITIYFSTIFTAKKAAKITAIEAIRSNQDIKISGKKLKTPKLIKKIFKTGGVIAYKNLKRNKKKYRTTVISIVVSVFVFISLSSFIDFGFKMSGLYYAEMSYNMSVFPNTDEQDNKELLSKITSQNEIERYSYLRFGLLEIPTKDVLSDFGAEVLTSYGETLSDTLNLSIYAVGEKEFHRYLEELGLNKEDQEKGILIDDYRFVRDKKTRLGNIYNFKNNSKITGKTVSFYDETKEEKDFSIEIVRSDKRPMGFENLYSEGGFLIVSDSILEENFDFRYSGIYLKAEDTDKVEAYIKNLMAENEEYKDLNYNNLNEYVKQMNAMVLIVSIFLYGFITVISLIGITNIFNTITTNMNLRVKEFAMLKSVGMTKKEFNRMIRLESIFYGFKSLLFGIPLGLAGSYLIYKAFNEGLEFGYIFPVKALLIVILFVAIIIGIIMKYSLSKINKQNIIDAIRNDNI